MEPTSIQRIQEMLLLFYSKIVTEMSPVLTIIIQGEGNRVFVNQSIIIPITY